MSITITPKHYSDQTCYFCGTPAPDPQTVPMPERFVNANHWLIGDDRWHPDRVDVCPAHRVDVVTRRPRRR